MVCIILTVWHWVDESYESVIIPVTANSCPSTACSRDNEDGTHDTNSTPSVGRFSVMFFSCNSQLDMGISQGPLIFTCTISYWCAIIYIITIHDIINVCFDFINEFCCCYRRNYGRHCYYQSSVEHKMASSPSGRSALTNQLHDCLFYLGSVMRLRMCRNKVEKYYQKFTQWVNCL